jgi:hypothetical protein
MQFSNNEDRFYFMFAFAVRAWLSLLFFVFVPFLLIHFGYELRPHQYLIIGASYCLIGLLDFSHTSVMAIKEYRRKRWVDIQHNGIKNFR